MTPIQRDTQRKQAELAAKGQQVFTPAAASAGNLDRTMRYKLGADRARLKKIASWQRKAEVKAEIVPEYAAYLDGVMAVGGGDEILTQVMIWAYDALHIQTFSTLARYALNNGVALPTEFARPLGAWLAESTAKLTLKIIDGEVKGLDSAALSELRNLTLWLSTDTASMDMHDEIRAKLHRACGELLFDVEPNTAFQHFETALKYDSHIRVKKRIKALTESQSPQGQAAHGNNDMVPPHIHTASSFAVASATTDTTDGVS